MRSAAAALLCLTSALAHAQVDAVVHADPSRGISLLAEGAAYSSGATSATFNPAGIVHTGMFELFYAHERSIARKAVNDGLYLALNPLDFIGIALSNEWMRENGNDFRKTAFGLAVGGEAISAGINFNWFSDGTVDKQFSVDLGVQTRFSRYFSLGAALKNADQPTRAGVTLFRRLDLGVGIRPFKERLTIGVDWVFDEQSGPAHSRLAYSLDAMVINGLHLFAGASHGFTSAEGLFLQLGLRLDTPHFGAGYALSGASQGLNHLAFARVTADKVPALPIRDGLIALVDLNSLGENEGQGTVGSLLGVKEADRYTRTVATLDRAATDPRLRGVVLKVETSGVGMGRAQELRNAVLKLRAAGKKVVALILSCDDQDFLVA
ncbi:MAG: hypothetical protein IPJ65_15740 [Archangiaceae bacterium]|nr:hypothetical protein [Archangiaceae bacterium]